MKPEQAKAILAELDNSGLNAPFGAIAELNYSGSIKQWINADTCEYHHSEDLRQIVEQAERIAVLEEVARAVANVGVVFDEYGEFELNEQHIKQAQELLGE